MSMTSVLKSSVLGSCVRATILVLGLSCHLVLAEAVDMDKSWSGSIYLVPISVTQKSQFSGEHENRLTNDLNNSGKTSSLFAALPMLRVDYAPSDSQTSYFFGNGQENVTKGQLALEFGLAHSLSKSSIVTFAVFPELPFSGETWEDPFLTREDRKKTNERAAGGRVKFEHAGNYSFDMQYAFSKNSLDVERSGLSLPSTDGQLMSMLDRNAELHRFNFNMNFSVLERIIISTGIQITTAQARGDANDFAEGAFVLRTFYIVGSHAFNTALRIGRMESVVDNPVFDRRQNDRLLSMEVVYKLDEPMGYKNISLLAIASWKKIDSTITFYDSQMSAIGFGVGYSW